VSSTRKKEDSNTCNHQLKRFKEIATEKCRMIPYGSGWGNSVPGHTFKLVHPEEECTKASVEYVNELHKCIRR
jgi:hypothetical protein